MKPHLYHYYFLLGDSSLVCGVRAMGKADTSSISPASACLPTPVTDLVQLAHANV